MASYHSLGLAGGNHRMQPGRRKRGGREGGGKESLREGGGKAGREEGGRERVGSENR